MTNWHAIETAPKDGRGILVYLSDCGNIERVKWFKNKWVVITGWWHVCDPEIITRRIEEKLKEGDTVWDEDLPDEVATDPTHWMELPAPPSE